MRTSEKNTSNIEKYWMHIDQEMKHRKRWIARPVLNIRYIRGIIRNQIKEKIHSRKTGQETTDPIIRARVIAKTRDRCYLCLRQWNPRMARLLPRLYFAHMQIDHVIAFSHFGPNDIANYMPICSQCNVMKTNLTLAEAKELLNVRRKYWG